MAIIEGAQAQEQTGPTEASGSKPSLWSALTARDFRLVWLGESISLLGDQFYYIALPWLTLQLTGSALALGTVAAAAGIPRAIFMVVGGAITDRFSPRSVMFLSNALRVILTGLLTGAVLTGTLQLWMLYVSAFLFGLVDAFFFPAQSAIVPQILKTNQLESGNALVNMTGQLASFVGPALAGLVIATLSGAVSMDSARMVTMAPAAGGIGVALGFDALTFAAAALAVWLVAGGRQRLQPESADGKPQGMMASIAQGLRYVWSDSPLRTLILVSTVLNFMITGPIGVGIPVLTNARFSEGAAALGAILSSFGGGALAGALLAGALPARRNVGYRMLGLIAISGACVAAFGPVQNLILAIGAGLLIGLTTGYTNVLLATWLQKRVPQALMGRVFSLVMLGSFGLGPISNAIAGIVAEVNLTGLFAIAGLGILIVCGLALTNPAVRLVGETDQRPANA